MTQKPAQQPEKRRIPLPILLVMGLVVVFAGVFLWEFINLSDDEHGVDEEDLTAETYMDTVNVLLANADPVQGAQLVAQRGCNDCHAGDNAGRLAPAHDEVVQVAAERRPPLTAAAYIYESIVYPGDYLVEGYQNNMPRVYGDELTQAQLGDIIAYLLEGAESSVTAADAETTPEVEAMLETEATAEALAPTEAPESVEALTEDSYMDVVEPLLADADAVNGEELVILYGCNACHGDEVPRALGPAHAGVADRAAEQHPPLQAAAYLYQSVIDPAAFVVEGYNGNTMPRDYATRIPDEDLGDILAYLLTLTGD